MLLVEYCSQKEDRALLYIGELQIPHSNASHICYFSKLPTPFGYRLDFGTEYLVPKWDPSFGNYPKP